MVKAPLSLAFLLALLPRVVSVEMEMERETSGEWWGLGSLLSSLPRTGLRGLGERHQSGYCTRTGRLQLGDRE